MKLGIKEIFIIVLGAALVLSLIFRPSKKIDTYEDEIKELNEKNDKLLNVNDSISNENKQLKEENTKVYQQIDSTKVELDKTNNKIKNLQNGKDKVSSSVNKLDADGVAGALSDYLKRR